MRYLMHAGAITSTLHKMLCEWNQILLCGWRGWHTRQEVMGHVWSDLIYTHPVCVALILLIILWTLWPWHLELTFKLRGTVTWRTLLHHETSVTPNYLLCIVLEFQLPIHTIVSNPACGSSFGTRYVCHAYHTMWEMGMRILLLPAAHSWRHPSHGWQNDPMLFPLVPLLHPSRTKW